MGIRGKLFLTAAAAVGLLLAVSGLYLENRLRTTQVEQIEAELLHGARGARELVLAIPAHALDDAADRMGAALDARVSIVSPDGRVLGDSEIPATGLAALDDHADRPEIVAARQHGQGTTRRYSETMDEDMLYLAIPYGEPDHPLGFVRVALPLDEVDRAAWRLRAALAVGGTLGLALALLGGALVSHLATRDLRALVAHARQVVHQRAGGDAAVQDAGEVESLARSIDHVGEELGRHVTTLAEERDRFVAVLEGMDAAVLAVDGEGRITLVNSRATRLLRLPAEVDGAPFEQVVLVPELHSLRVRAVQGETAFEELILPGNPPRVATIRVTPQRAGGAVLVMHDITRQQRLETVRRDFVANVSHELRTPVTIIRANAETLIDGAIDDPVHGREFLSAIGRNAVRMSQIVSDLLDLTRIESGKLDLDIRPVGLRAVATRALDSVSAAAAVRSLDVRIDVADDLRVLADEQALDQVLVNLLDNAVKYTLAHGHVVVEARPVESGVRVAVRDDGPGIAAKHQDRVFERFYRVDEGRSREMGGTGLGLAIVKHLVAALGGQLGYETADGGGAVFWFVLDRAVTASSPASGPIDTPLV